MNKIILFLALIGLASCSDNQFEGYIGYWEQEKPAQNTFFINGFKVVKIETDGKLFKYIENAHDESQRTYALTEINNELVLEGRLPIQLSKDKNTLYLSNNQYQRIDQNRFDEVLSLVAMCDELEAQYKEVPVVFSSFDLSFGGNKSAKEKAAKDAEDKKREEYEQQIEKIEIASREIPNCSFSDD